MAHVAQYKKDIVKKLEGLLEKYSVVAMVDVENLPAKQYQDMREKLRGSVEMFMAKKRLMRLAFQDVEKEKPGVSKLADHFRGMPALLFTDQNPFKLFSTLKKSTSPAPAKAGQTAPKDIVVPAGPTGFAPGPVIGELGSLGIKTKVDGGKIAVLNDTTVAKEGDTISEKLAGMLTRLKIMPMEVGLAVTAIYEDGIVYTKSVLDVDEDEFREEVYGACSDAFALAVGLAYPTTETVPFLITKAQGDAMALGTETVIYNKDTMPNLLAKAECQMNMLK